VRARASSGLSQSERRTLLRSHAHIKHYILREVCTRTPRRRGHSVKWFVVVVVVVGYTTLLRRVILYDEKRPRPKMETHRGMCRRHVLLYIAAAARIRDDLCQQDAQQKSYASPPWRLELVCACNVCYLLFCAQVCLKFRYPNLLVFHFASNDNH